MNKIYDAEPPTTQEEIASALEKFDQNLPNYSPEDLREILSDLLRLEDLTLAEKVSERMGCPLQTREGFLQILPLLGDDLKNDFFARKIFELNEKEDLFHKEISGPFGSINGFKAYLLSASSMLNQYGYPLYGASESFQKQIQQIRFYHLSIQDEKGENVFRSLKNRRGLEYLFLSNFSFLCLDSEDEKEWGDFHKPGASKESKRAFVSKKLERDLPQLKLAVKTLFFKNPHSLSIRDDIFRRMTEGYHMFYLTDFFSNEKFFTPQQSQKILKQMLCWRSLNGNASYVDILESIGCATDLFQKLKKKDLSWKSFDVGVVEDFIDGLEKNLYQGEQNFLSKLKEIPTWIEKQQLFEATKTPQSTPSRVAKNKI